MSDLSFIVNDHLSIASVIPDNLEIPNQPQKAPKYPVGPDHRMGNEGLIGAIGGWTGDLRKQATWLATATGTIRNRPIKDLIDRLNANVANDRGKRLQCLISDLKQVELFSKQIDTVFALNFEMPTHGTTAPGRTRDYGTNQARSRQGSIGLRAILSNPPAQVDDVAKELGTFISYRRRTRRDSCRISRPR